MIVCARRCWRWSTLPLLITPLPPALHHRAAAARSTRKILPPLSGHREDRAGSGHGRLRRRAVLRPAALGHAAVAAASPVLTAEEQAFLDGPVRRGLPDDQRLGDHARARRPGAGDLGVPEEAQVLRHDHRQGIRRPRFLGLRAFARDREAGLGVGDAELHRRRAQFARPGRTARRTTAPTNRRTITCRAWPTAARFPASA